MIYGEEKKRQMLRSVLPSKASKAARLKRKKAHRQNRRRIKSALHCFEDESDLSNRIGSSEKIKNYAITEMKRDRRDADKVNHFVRWAESVTSHIPEEEVQERYYYFLKHIGGVKDLIREHAVSHFIGKWEFNDTAYGRRYRIKKKPPNPLKHMERMLEEAFEHDHKGLNRQLKEFWLVRSRCWRRDPCMFPKHSLSWYSRYDHSREHCLNRLLISSKKDIPAVANSIYNGRAMHFNYYQAPNLWTYMINYFESRGYDTKCHS